jgi:U3 small nucleolar RNA-associated protein MPP10
LEYDKKPDPDELDDSEEDLDEEPEDGADAEVPTQYKHFFAAPSKPSKSTLKKKQVVHFASDDSDASADEIEDDNEYDDDAMPRQRDLFGNDDEQVTVDTEQGLTAHEKRQRNMQKIISEMEQENVAVKDWTMIGEASVKNRPVNSLLEEDLEFEVASKPVPVVTEEVTQSLEDLIKKRIADVPISTPCID